MNTNGLPPVWYDRAGRMWWRTLGQDEFLPWSFEYLSSGGRWIEHRISRDSDVRPSSPLQVKHYCHSYPVRVPLHAPPQDESAFAQTYLRYFAPDTFPTPPTGDDV